MRIDITTDITTDVTRAGKSASPNRRPTKAASNKAPARKAAHAVRDAAAGSPRRQRIDDRRATVLRAALDLFSRFGLHGVSVDQVAERAEVSKSSLLYYFANKEDLYVSVLRDLLSLWLEPLRAFSAEQEPSAAIADYIRRKLVLSRDWPDASRLFCLELIQGAPLLRDELAHELHDLVAEKAEVIRGWVDSGRLAPIEPVHLVFALWATTQHYADFAVQVEAVAGRTLNDPDFFEQTVDNVQRIVLGGVAARTPSTQSRQARSTS